MNSTLSERESANTPPRDSLGVAKLVGKVASIRVVGRKTEEGLL